MKRRSVWCVLILLISQYSLNGQSSSIKLPKITPADFKLPASSAIDSSTGAVILTDNGVTDFVGNSQGWFSYVFHRRTRILVINQKAFDAATVKIRLYQQQDGPARQQLSEIVASTFNLDNGQVVETKMQKSDVFTDRLDKSRSIQKFTLPGVKEGSIIDYAYAIQSDFIFNLPDWEFQSDEYPCLWSEYSVEIPSTLVYMFQRSGVHPFEIDKTSNGSKTYLITQPRENMIAGQPDERLSVSAATFKHRWAMKDIPVFNVESYLTSPVNYIDKIEFQLHQTNNGETAEEAVSWKKENAYLLKRADFGLPLVSEEDDKAWLTKALDGITSGTKADIDRAKDVYAYVSDNVTCTNHDDIYITTSLRDVLKKRSGTVGDINLLLCAFLQETGIRVSPVILSTRENGYNSASYPMMDRFNYVICRAVIDGKVYYLDASHHNLGFGHMPDYCYNGHARIISNTDSASIYFYPDSIREQQVTLVTIAGDEKNKSHFTGSFQMQFGNIQSYAIREAISKEGEKEFFSDMAKEGRGDAELLNTWVDSLNKPEFPLKLNGDFSLHTGENTDVLYFSPIMFAGYRSNPFTAATRKYPVEMRFPINDVYIMNMDIPAGFEIDEMPKNTRVSFNNGEGQFEYIIQKSETGIQLRTTLKFSRANFDPDDYVNLREFFNYIVKKESEQIVFKRKN